MLVSKVPAAPQAQGADAVVAGRRVVRVVQVFGLAVEPGKGGGRFKGFGTAAYPWVGDTHRHGIATAVGIEEVKGVGVTVVMLTEHAQHCALTAQRQLILAFIEGHLVAFDRAAQTQ
ncbi:hypothetical protein D3C84_1022150 [compost metagenome]